VTSYDSHGRIVEKRSTNTDGSERGLITYTYDDVARTRTYDSRGPGVRMRRVASYDAAGHIIHVAFDNLNDVTYDDSVYDYVWDGDRLITDTWTTDGQVERTTYDYCD